MKLLSKLVLTLALVTYVSANERYVYINWDDPPHDVTFYEGDILKFTTKDGRNSTISLVGDNENSDKSFDGVLNENQSSFVQKPLPPGEFTFQDLNTGRKSFIKIKKSNELAKEVRPIDRLKNNADATNNENAKPNTEASPKSDATAASPKSDAKATSPKTDAKEASPKTDTKSTTQKPSSDSSSSKTKVEAANDNAATNQDDHVEKGASSALKASLSLISAACVLSLGYLL
ncbi:hypothetical protein RB653_000252 [Dictyostelium firmibasis]|uniref:Uncharacterized protein n=1 Tax=Dictyostelium firmibasis TaxID=79012 RepID=A0AAN7YXR5_9MYCE